MQSSAPTTAAASGSASANTATTNAATDSDDSSHSNYDEVLSYEEDDPAEPEKSRSDNFQLNIPSILMQPHQSLTQMDQKMLGESLQPVLDSLKALDAQALLNLERVENGARLKDG